MSQRTRAAVEVGGAGQCARRVSQLARSRQYARFATIVVSTAPNVSHARLSLDRPAPNNVSVFDKLNRRSRKKYRNRI